MSDLRVYRAERKAWANSPAVPLDGTPKAAQAYADRITRSAWWARTCVPSWMGDDVRGRGIRCDRPPRRVIVTPTRARGASASWSLIRYRGRWLPEIRLGRRWALAEPWVILHELAHIMAFAEDDRGHGRTFARCYLSLVRRWLGPEAARALREAYRAEGVKWRAT